MLALSMAQNAKKASHTLRSIDAKLRQEALTQIAAELVKHSAEIIKANELDIINAKKNNLNEAMIDRLKLTSESIQNMASAVLEIRDQKL